MSDETNIEWCDSTFNPWIGCTKVGPECDNCYAEADFDIRRHRVKWGSGNPRSRTAPDNWKKPLQWNRQHAEFFAENGRRRRVFCASLGDVFDNEVPAEWRHDLFNLIRDTPNLDWLLLTKRPQNIIRMVQESGCVAGNDTRYLPGNVWLGASAGNQKSADTNVQALLRAKVETGARFAFLSMEPLLGPVDLRQAHVAKVRLPRVDWVIVGGESGQNARPMHPDWARSLRDQCEDAGVPFLFKQWGEWTIASHENGHFDSDMARNSAYWVDQRGQMHKPSSLDLDNPIGMFRAGKKAAGRLLDGVQHDGYPESKP